jgi:RNA polymerase sigma factor (sigma-70 family)
MTTVENSAGEIRLSVEQQARVASNLGLVALHIRRNVRNLGGRRCDRDYDDLFQEGVMGLMAAARSFDPARGIPFAAFALPRIHTAVSTALYENESLVRRPRRRKRKRKGAPVGAAGDSEHSSSPSTASGASDPGEPKDDRPRVGGLEIDPPARTVHADDPGMTLGDRIREKYDRALELASRRSLRRRGMRADRARLVQLIVDERLTVAEESERRALRQIARDTQSSYSRVLQCEQRLHAELRRVLAGDLEFRRLRAAARCSREGHHTALDGDMQRELVGLAAEEFWRKLNLHSPRARRDILAELAGDEPIDATGSELERAVKTRVMRLDSAARDAWLLRVSDETARRDPSPRESPVAVESPGAPESPIAQPHEPAPRPETADQSATRQRPRRRSKARQRAASLSTQVQRGRHEPVEQRAAEQQSEPCP